MGLEVECPKSCGHIDVYQELWDIRIVFSLF